MNLAAAVIWKAEKDPDEVLDFQIDWTTRLEGDQILEFVATVLEGSVEIDSSSHDGKTVTLWLSGGAVGERARIHNRIETQAGRVFDQTVSLCIVVR